MRMRTIFVPPTNNVVRVLCVFGALLLLIGTTQCSSVQELPQKSAPGELPPPPIEYAHDTIPIRTDDGALAIYGVSSAQVILEYTGQRAGTRKVIFDDYGMRLRIEEFSRPFPPGTPGPSDSLLTIRTPEWLYRLDYYRDEAFRFYNRTESMQRFIDDDVEEKRSMGEELIKGMNMTRLADTTIQGYECRTYQQKIPGVVITRWIWRGVILREHFDAFADNIAYFAEPVLVAINIEVDDETFEPIKGYEIKDVSDPEQMDRFQSN